MDGNKSNLISNNSSSNPSLSHNYHYPHLPYPSPSTPFSSYYLSPTGILSERTNGGAEDSGFPTHGFTPGIDPSEFTDANAKPAEPELDGHGSESEDGVGFSDEPAKQNTHRGSGSKRSRAAEVHNLSEKRRRSRINEKMKALQNLIPNSNKTDKASMLDEAIEYLKQLQLQVQMLSMRNGLNLHPMYMPAGVLQPLQSPEFNMGFTVDNRSTMNMGVGALHLNIDSSARTPYGLSDRCTSSHPPIISPHMPSMNTTGTSFGMESSQSHHGPFQLPVDTELFTEGMVSERQLDSGHNTRHLQDEIKPVSVAASLNLDGSVLGRERSEDMRSKDYTDNHIFTQHLNSFASGDRKPGSPEF